MAKPIDKLSERELMALYDKRHAADMAVCDSFIAAGRGQQRGSEIRKMTDPLALKWIESADAFMAVVDEIKARERWHGTRKPIKRSA